MKYLLLICLGLLQNPQVKKKSRNHNFGYVRTVILITLVVVLVAVVGLIVHWQPLKTVKRQHLSLIDSIERKKGAKFRRMLSNQYHDRWGFDVNDATEAMLDMRSQFMALGINSENEAIKISGKEATVTVNLSLTGTPLPGGGQITRHINGLEQPWVFEWQKESFLPSSWRLISIENKSLPENLWNYEPGSIRRAMQGN